MKDNLIDLVFCATPVWDKSHKQHHNRYVLSKEWKKISSQLGVEESEAKSAWKNLRQEYGKQLRKLQGRPGDAATNEIACSWPFFEKLQFLKDQFPPRPPTGNLTLSDNDINLDETGDTNSETNESHEQFSQIYDCTSGNSHSCCDAQSSSCRNSEIGELVSGRGYRKRLATRAAIEEELIELEREKLDLVKRKRATDVNDEDEAFLNSLLPTIKTLSPKDKFLFRMKVQQALYDLAFKPQTEPASTT